MIADNPYKDLYIYYLAGRINSDNGIFGSEFIGNWQEDDFSWCDNEYYDYVLLYSSGQVDC